MMAPVLVIDQGIPTRAAVKRMFNVMDAKLDRIEKRIDALLERQASKGL